MKNPLTLKKKSFLFERLVLLCSNVILSSFLKMWLFIVSIGRESWQILSTCFSIWFWFGTKSLRAFFSFELMLLIKNAKWYVNSFCQKISLFLVFHFFHYFPRNNEVFKTLNQCKALLYLVYRYQLQTL